MNEIKEYTEKMFEDIKHIDENEIEYWEERELMEVLEYKEWRKFNKVIQKAMEACDGSNYYILDHFVLKDKMVIIGSNTSRKIKDYKLSRYACYLIVQNCNPRIKIIALAQTYFAIQTRKQELSEKEYNELTEDEKRLYRRNQARKGNYNLNKTAVNSGVKDLARFHNAGYKGLYNGETADDIFKRKKLRYREDILDNMGSEELADNIFRIAQTDAKLKRDNVDNEYTANSVHYEVGKEVRDSIKRLGGTMPEDLPTPDRSLKELEKLYNNKKICYNGCEVLNMNESLLYNISYDDMKKIIKSYYAQQGRNVDLRISNEIDTDRFAGMVTTSIQMTEKSTIGGIESKSQCYLDMSNLKEIVGSVLEQEGKELLDLTNNAVSSSKIEGYGMGEHEVKSITGKSFTITAREKKQTLGR